MTPEQLDEIEQRANRASQAPWEVTETVDDTEYGTYAAYGVEPIAPLEWYSDSDTAHTALEVLHKEDAEFVAAARTDVPNLVAEVRRLQGQIAAVKEALSRHPKCDRHKDSSGIACGWKRVVHDITYALEGGNND